MGNVVIGQSGGPTAVINASLAGAIRCAMDKGIKKIFGMHHGIDGFIKHDLIDMDEYLVDVNDLSLLKRTPAAFLGSCRYKLPKIEGNEDLYESMFEYMDEMDIEYFLYNGGNDSMDTILKLSEYAERTGRNQKFVGIPKTIDNDLAITDHTPGYGSAAKFIGTCVKEMICDNESFAGKDPRIVIVEIMGRNAGWLTAASALARDTDCTGPDLIYLPEVNFNIEDFLARMDKLIKTKKSIVVCVSEGIHLADGTLVCELANENALVDAFGHKHLSGCGYSLFRLVADNFGINPRVVDLSLLQRCATHLASRTDVEEAYSAGYIACETAISGESAKMITLRVPRRVPYNCFYEATNIADIANIEKKMPRSWITKDGTNVTEDFIKYVSPLVIGTLPPYYVGGLPRHMTLRNKRKEIY
ncbi:MAG: 6-phosphofructokinase [Eubacterium sp.]|nr:6-phosphofructokinase [Eubacterium sp.]